MTILNPLHKATGNDFFRGSIVAGEEDCPAVVGSGFEVIKELPASRS
ncbi:MAG: hypothetical protein KME10_16525 [Plectolyngbya sp. WJT66-NPBG17]|nr:hypothetical protein [Plectolyngbya sp. WJT66-NPBG17]